MAHLISPHTDGYVNDGKRLLTSQGPVHRLGTEARYRTRRNDAGAEHRATLPSS